MGVPTDTYKGRTNDGIGLAKALMSGKASDMEAVLQAARNWQPSPTWYTFDEECGNRIDYLNKTMQEDMVDVLKRRFPRKYDRIKKEQVNLPIYRATVRGKAKVFQDGEFYLMGTSGERMEGDGDQAFQDMLQDGCFWSAFKDADRYTQAGLRPFVELWYDERAGCIKPNVWPQNLVYAVVDPERYWSVDDCRIVAFEMPSETGWDNDRRWKVWTKIPAEGGGWEAAHFMSGRNMQTNPENGRPEHVYYNAAFSGNADKVAPYTDPITGEPMFPFVQWRPDLLMAIYWLGAEDSLTINRQANSAMTDMNWTLHYQAAPIGGWEWIGTGEPTGDPPSNVEPNPDSWIQGGNWRPYFASPDYDPAKLRETWNALMKIEAMLDGNSATAEVVDSDRAESGYALKIRNLPTTEHRQDMIEIYRPHVLETLRRAIVLHNAHASEMGRPQIVGMPMWEPGRLDPPVDEEAEARTWQLKIAKNVSTAIDWRMSLTGESFDEAKIAVDRNAEINSEAAQSKAGAFGLPTPGAGGAGGLSFPAGDDEPDDDEDDS